MYSLALFCAVSEIKHFKLVKHHPTHHIIYFLTYDLYPSPSLNTPTHLLPPAINTRSLPPLTHTEELTSLQENTHALTQLFSSVIHT